MKENVDKSIGALQSRSFQSFVEAISRVMNLPTSIWIPTPDKTAMHIEAAVGLSKEYVKKAELKLDETSVTGEAFLTGTIVTVYDILSDDRWKYKDYAEEMGWKSALCVPIEVYGKIIGVISVYTFVNREFSEYEKRLLEDYATQIELTESYKRLFVLSENIEQLITVEPKKVLEQIVKNACQVTGADAAVVYPFDPLREEFYDVDSVATYGLEHALDLTEKPRIKKGMAAYVISKGEVVFENLAVDDPKIHETSSFIKREKIKAFIGLSLKVADQVLGVLYVDYRTPHTFGEREKDTIHLFAHQAAIAINNSRLFQQANFRADALEKLHQVGPDLLSISGEPKELEGILNRIVKNAQQVMGADLIDLYQYKQTDDEFVMPPVRIGKLYRPEVVKKSILEDDILYTIIALDQPRYTINALRDEILTRPFSIDRVDRPSDRFVVREKVEGSAAVPLSVSNEKMGIMFANFRTPQTFSMQQRELIELFANQAAIAIRNARLYEKVQQRLVERLNDIKTFREIYEKMHEGDLRDVLNLIAAKALELTGAKYGGVWLLNKTHTSLTFGGLAGGAVTEEPPDLPVDEESENSINKQVILSGETYLCKNVKEDEYYKEWYEDSRSEIAVPLKYQGKVIGTLNVESTLENGFTGDHRKLLEALAGQAAIVVQNHRLVERLENLDRMGRELTSGIRLHEDEILELIYQQASQLMDTGNMYIALYNDLSEMISFPLMYVDGNRKGQPARKFGEDGIGKTEWIIQNNESIIHATNTEAKEWYGRPGYGDYLKKDKISLPSWVGVPMQVGEKVLGVIATYHPDKEHLYGQEELDVLSVMARQAAIAIDNSRLYYDVNRRLEALVSFGEQITSRIDLTEKEIIDLIYQQASLLMDADNMYIALYDDATKLISFPLMYVDGNRKEQPARKFGEMGLGKTESIIQSNKPIFHITKAEAEKWYAQPGHQEFIGNISASWIGVPMQVGEKILGVISTYHPTEDNWYTKNDLTMLEGIARVAAIALENVHLYEEARGEVVAAKQLSTLGTAIAALQHRINNTFNIIIPNVDRLRRRVDLSDPDRKSVV